MSNDNANDTANDGAGGDNLAELRAAADRGRKLERENAFLRAGVDLESPTGKMFAKAYDGSLDDLAAVIASATEVGALRAPATPPAPTPDPAAAQAAAAAAANDQSHQDVRNALLGGQPVGDTAPGTPDPYDDSLGNYWKDKTNGMPQELAGLAAIDRVLMAASDGDKRVLLSGRPLL